MNEEAISTSTSSSTSSTPVPTIHSRSAEAARQAWQNVGRQFLNDGKGIYLKKVDLKKDDLENIKVVKSNTAGIVTERPYNPSSKLNSLEELINDGSKFGTNLVVMILSITAKSRDNMTSYQQKYNGIKGNNGTIRYDRTMVVLCPFSKEGSNAAII